MLYQLSYAGLRTRVWQIALERETRIELATNSLEGCDSTIELLPPDTNQLFHSKATPSARSTRERLPRRDLR